MASLNPLPSTALGKERTKHLLRRTTYNYSQARINTLSTQTPQQIVTALLDFGSDLNGLSSTEPYIHSTNGENVAGELFIYQKVSKNYLNLRALYSWYLDEAKQCETMQFKLATFLHQILITTIQGNNEMISIGYYYLKLLLLYSKGSFKTLSYKMTLDNNMLVYLDNRYNTKYNPNENYAREFLELFTITKGPQVSEGNYTNYTEYDIQQAAKVLTGFQWDYNSKPEYVDPETGIQRGYPNYYRHDTTDKTFSAAFNNTVITGASGTNDTERGIDMMRELQDFIDMVFDQDETSKVMVRRLYRHFVRKEITADVENTIIGPLAVTLKANNYELSSVLEILLVSEHFYDLDDGVEGDEIIGGQIKDPIELGLQTINMLEIPTPDISTNTAYHNEFWGKFFHNEYLKYTEFFLFRATSVAGYKPIYQEPLYDRYWITSSTVFYRFRLGKTFMDIRNRVTSFGFLTRVNFDVVDFIRNSGHFSDPKEAQILFEELIDLLLIRDPEPTQFTYFYNDLLLGDLSPINWRFAWENYLLSGDDSDVRIALERTFEGIIGSPEYQIY